MKKMTLNKIEYMLKDVENGKAKAKELYKLYSEMVELSNRFKEDIRELSDDELDSIAGGGAYIGDIYKCETFLAQCKSLLIGGGIDICKDICTDND